LRCQLRGRIRNRVHVTQCSFYGGQDHIESHVYEIHSSQRDHQFAAYDDTLIQYVIQHVQQRDIIFRVVPAYQDCIGSCHYSDLRDTNEYAGHGPVHSMTFSSFQSAENRRSKASKRLRSARFTSREVWYTRSRRPAPIFPAAAVSMARARSSESNRST